MDKVLFSHNTDHWCTPKWLYDIFMNKMSCIDPCPLHCKEDNVNKVYLFERIFVNPPYSALDQWVNFVSLNRFNNEIFLLIPSRTDTKYFYDLMKMNPQVIFITGRLRFNDSKPAPFPSLLLIFSQLNNSKRPLCLTHNDLWGYLETIYG